jgi:hypothetical protein
MTIGRGRQSERCALLNHKQQTEDKANRQGADAKRLRLGVAGERVRRFLPQKFEIASYRWTGRKAPPGPLRCL